MKHTKIAILFTVAMFIPWLTSHGAPFTLENYISEVEAVSPGLKSARLAGEGYGGLAEGGKIVTSPHLFGNYSSFDNKEETPNPALQGNRTEGDRYSVGVAANTPIGLGARYSYNVTNNQVHNAAQLPVPNYTSAYNQLEVTQSLVRNGFGSEVRAQRDFIASSNMANAYANQYSALAQLVQAENTYWRLAFARRAVEVQKDVLARASKVLQWARRRVNMQLGDRADVLQAQASYDLRRIELMAAEEEERNAARAFNLLRNQESLQVKEELQIPTLENTVKLAAASKAGTRLDVKAAEMERAATTAAVQLEKEKFKPTVDLFANIAWTGLDRDSSQARSEAFRSNNSNTAVGINFNVPLHVPAVRRGLSGGDKTQEAAIHNLEQRRLEEANDWTVLQSRLADAKARLDLLKSVESVQREKYENEQSRLLRGRTTTYQAITFEQDYAATQLSTLRTQNEVMQLLAQVKLFQGE